ncbi:retrovirus-related Pol polyprotein from type-1 retrotransposable element R2 [Elysia marginata]|uniref:Retrovirus-related Pol polyprotein from type-1 retrotransposable element R2 n=1 Tax=Elysia marginata TaxID=1093978 RepID=A0AAV4IZM1_9GAST|nr:retrovirus-related Pol polyprotein from type-1 retrotransposable element R2 [Elysia marginata]
MGIPDHLVTLIRSLYVDQEAQVRTEYGNTDSFAIGKGVRQGCILSPCLFNLYSEYIMREAKLDEVESGIKIGGNLINNLRYADDTTLQAETKGLQKIFKNVQDSSVKHGLYLNIKKTNVMPTEEITKFDIDNEKVEMTSYSLVQKFRILEHVIERLYAA